jgi:hypothetical protein
MRIPSLALAILLVAGLLNSTALAQSSAWVDRVTEKWNTAGAGIPAPPASQEARAALAKRCASFVVTEGAAAAVIAKAGWTPFLHLDKQITRDDLEVVGGMAAATPDCQPAVFNLFVFTGDRFAGTLSPSWMSLARDGVAGAVRLTGPDTITAEFARYTATDAECCPSSIVRVTYRINRSGATPVLEAVESRRVR